MVEKQCDDCGEETKLKYLGKIRGKNLCKKCRIKVRKNRREEIINELKIGDDLKELDRKIINEIQRKSYRKRNPIKKRKKVINEEPKIKGSIRAKPKQKSESYLNFQETQELLRILMRRGLDFEEAKEEIKTIKDELRKTREKMKTQNKSEEEIKTKQKQLLEELWNY